MTQGDNQNQLQNNFEEIKNETVFRLSKLIKLNGLNLSESRLFSFMFLEDSPMTLDEMSQSLGMSKTSMSTGVRSLLDTQMVEKSWKKGVRKDLYRVEKDLYKAFAGSFIEQWITSIEHNIKQFYETLKELDSLSGETSDVNQKKSLEDYSKKIINIIEFYSWLLQILHNLKSEIDERPNNEKNRNKL